MLYCYVIVCVLCIVLYFCALCIMSLQQGRMALPIARRLNYKSNQIKSKMDQVAIVASIIMNVLALVASIIMNVLAFNKSSSPSLDNFNC